MRSLYRVGVPDLFSSYPHGAAWDEMVTAENVVRPPYSGVHRALTKMDLDVLTTRTEALARSYLHQGVTFDYAGEEKAFPMDAIPRVIAADEWETVEAGVRQRVATLEALLDDVYSTEGLPQAVKDGVLPWELIASSSHFHRAVAGIRPTNGVRIHVAGVDLIRDEQGTFRVLEDNVRVPSGVSYVLSNRGAMANVLPEAFSSLRVRAVADYPRMLLRALRAAAPAGVTDPTIVVLTPGVYNSAYYEHTLLARSMGVELVEGRDLVCSGGVVRMRTTRGLQPVDVIYRRVDDDFIDPVHFRVDSLLGVPGLVAAVRTGRVSIANAIGNGIADDKLIYSYLPDLTRYYLDEDPVLPNVDTYRCVEPDALAHVLEHLDEMVVKPVDGSGGKGIVIGPRASAAQLDALRASLQHDPRGWIAQPVVQLSTIPTLIDGQLRPRHVDLRPFAVNDGEQVRVLPGGLTRVALAEGELVVNSSQGGGSKDTWVLSRPYRHDRPAQGDVVTHEIITMDPPPATPDDTVRAQQEQQQQHQDSQQQERNDEAVTSC